MKKTSILLVAAALLLGATSCKNTVPALKNHSDSVNWVLGESYALGLKSSGLQLDKKMILRAVEATLDGKEQPLSDTAYRDLLAEVNSMIMLQQREKQQQLESQNRNQEEVYFKKLLAENPNVKTTKEGFYYEVLQEGKGNRAKLGGVVTFDYRAFFTNGQVFDQTYGNREPIRKVVGNPMFAGLQEAFTYMSAGSKYRFYFPSEKAFGAEGSDGIPPYTTMIYEVELHKVE